MSNSIGLIPRVGLDGIFTFTGPFVIYNKYKLEVVSDRSFDYFDHNNFNVFEKIYDTNSLSIEDYNIHRTSGVRIITFRYQGIKLIDIPSIYITGLAEEDIGYRWFHLAVSLGVLPKDIDLTRVKEAVEETLLEEMGVTADIKFATSEMLGTVDVDVLDSAELVRQNAIQNASTNLKDKMYLQQQVENLRGQVDHLMNLIYDADIRP